MAGDPGRSVQGRAIFDPEYRKLNPKGVVPTLVHDGKPVIELTLICEYIDRLFRSRRG